jgi:hypothetical protein
VKKKKNQHAKTQENATARSLIQIAETLSADLLRATIPLYYQGDTGQPELLGSGVLLSLDGIRFLLTAGHVLDHLATTQLTAGVPAGLLTVAGLPTRLRSLGAKSEEDDQIDLGMMRLQGTPWEKLEANNFLTWTELDTAAPTSQRHTYALVGYPVSINKRGLQGGLLTAAAFRVGGIECELSAYEEKGIDPMNHVMVGFDKNAVLGADGPRNAPDLYGASGGGLWRFGRRLRDATQRPKLSAIATEWQKKGRHRYILGTRIQLILEALAEKYPDVGRVVGDHLAAS